MAREPIFAVVDIGTSKIVSIAARLGPEGELKPLGVGVAPSLGVQQGVIDDFKSVQEGIRESLDECLRYMGRNSLSGVYAVVNGEHLTGRNSSEGLSNDVEPVAVTERRLRSLISEAAGALREEADSKSQQTLHVIPMRYRLDGVEGVRNPTGLRTNDLQLETHIVRGLSIPLDNIARALQSCKTPAQGLVAHPLASAEGVLTADEREMGVAVVDIGAGTMKVAVYRGGTPCHSSVVAMGGNQLTRDLAVSLRIPYQMAEELKIEQGHALPDELSSNEDVLLPDTQMHPKRTMQRRELCEPLYLRCLQMLKLVHAELSKAESLDLPGGIVLTGGGAKMRGLAEMTSRGFGTPVRIGAPLWYAGLPESLRQPELAAALGTLQWSVKHRHLSDPGHANRGLADRGHANPGHTDRGHTDRGHADRGHANRDHIEDRDVDKTGKGWSPRSLFRRPFAKVGAAGTSGDAPAETLNAETFNAETLRAETLRND